MPGFLLLLPFTAFIELGCVLAINKCKELLDQDQQRAQQQQQQRLAVPEAPLYQEEEPSRQPFPFTRSTSLCTSLYTILEAENEDGELSEDSELVQTPSRSQTRERRRRRRSRESATKAEPVQAAAEDVQYMPSSPASHYTSRPLSESDHKNMPVISLPYSAQQQHPHAAGGYYYYPASAPQQQHYHDQQLLAYQQQHYHHYHQHQRMMAAAAAHQQHYHHYYQQPPQRHTLRTIARE